MLRNSMDSGKSKRIVSKGVKDTKNKLVQLEEDQTREIVKQNRPHTAIVNHMNRNLYNADKYMHQNSQFKKVRRFENQTAKNDVNYHNGIHPGLPLFEKGGKDERFELLAEDLIPQNANAFMRVEMDYNWNKQEEKHTLKEFEK